MSDERPKCSFCGKPDHESLVLIAAPGAMICDLCIELCRDLLGAHRERIGVKVVRLPDPLTYPAST